MKKDKVEAAAWINLTVLLGAAFGAGMIVQNARQKVAWHRARQRRVRRVQQGFVDYSIGLKAVK